MYFNPTAIKQTVLNHFQITGKSGQELRLCRDKDRISILTWGTFLFIGIQNAIFLSSEAGFGNGHVSEFLLAQ